jgi:hypothetical protein
MKSNKTLPLTDITTLITCLPDWLNVHFFPFMDADFQISGDALVCITNSPGRQSQKTQNAANKQTASETQGTNVVELQYVHWPLLLLNFTILPSQNKTYHKQPNQPPSIKNAKATSIMENYKHSKNNFSRPKLVPTYFD